MINKNPSDIIKLIEKNSSRKKVFITGITGQDGSLLSDWLLNNTDHLVIGGIRRTSTLVDANIKNSLNFLNNRFFSIYFDLLDPVSIENSISILKPDYFINFAAQSFVKASWDIPVQTFETNSLSIICILEFIKKYCPWCRFYNAGSSEEFGNAIYTPQDENHPLNPFSPYAASKIAARKIIESYRRSYNLFAIQGWLFNHESERRGEEFVTRKITRGVARIIWESKQNYKSITPIKLGNLNAKRDWSYAKDVIHAIWKMINNQEPREYVVCSGEQHTIKEFVEKSFIHAGINGIWTGENENTKFISTQDNTLIKPNTELVTIDICNYRPSDVNSLCGSYEKINEELNWYPTTSFDELVKKMVLHDIENFQ